jgi:thiol-disulfide isomerase/thioredoxin
MRSLLALGTFLAVCAGAADDVPVATIGPACPEWTPSTATGAPHLTVTYNPSAPGARLTAAQSLTLVAATATGSGNRFESAIIPMTQAADGTWRVEYTEPVRGYMGGYQIFLFVDDKGQTDDNHTLYWEVLNCRNGEPEERAVWSQASAYEGRLLVPGIQRPPDLPRAVEILKADLKRHPDRYLLYQAAWQYEVQLAGATPAAYEAAAREVEAYLHAYGNKGEALNDALLFILPEMQKLPARVIQQFRDALDVLPQKAELVQHDGQGNLYPVRPDDTARVARLVDGFKREAADLRADLDYYEIGAKRQTQREMADAYFAFASTHPESRRQQEAYGRAFEHSRQLNDVAGAERAFEKLAALERLNPLPLFLMAEFYISQQIKPERALELADRVAAIYKECEAPTSHRHLPAQPGRVEMIRAQAHLMLKDLPAARADMEAAAKTAPDRVDILYSLGQVREQMGDLPQALDAYLGAAAAPNQESPAPREAYERVFAARKLGSKEDAEQKLLQRAAENSRRVAAAYTPLAMTRPAPEFAFTDLAGKRFDAQSAKGKPTVFTFWSIWCVPCVAEMPAIEEFQQRHPEANVLAVEIGHKAEEVAAFLASHKLRTLRVALSAEWPKGFGFPSVPAAVVMDRFGQIEFFHVGPLADVGAILGKDLEAMPGSR